jgi:hypothetical protein
MGTSIVTTPRRWFVRGFMVGVLVCGSLTAVSYFFRSQRGGNLLGTTPDHYEAIGFPCTLWETGNTYGGLFVDLLALAVNAGGGLAVATACGWLTLRFRGRLNDLVNRLDDLAAIQPQRGGLQFSLRGLFALSGLAALAAAGAHYALAGNPAVLPMIYGLGPWILVAVAFLPMGLSWQRRVVVLVPAALGLMGAAVAVGASLRPPVEFDKVLMYIFICWTPQSVLVALALTAGLLFRYTAIPRRSARTHAANGGGDGKS